jgi:hypothetical protein
MFGRVEGRSVVAEFDGGALTSDAGGLLLGAAANAKRSAVERGEGSGSTRRARVSFNPARRQPPAAVSASCESAHVLR